MLNKQLPSPLKVRKAIDIWSEKLHLKKPPKDLQASFRLGRYESPWWEWGLQTDEAHSSKRPSSNAGLATCQLCDLGQVASFSESVHLWSGETAHRVLKGSNQNIFKVCLAHGKCPKMVTAIITHLPVFTEWCVGCKELESLLTELMPGGGWTVDMYVMKMATPSCRSSWFNKS